MISRIPPSPIPGVRYDPPPYPEGAQKDEHEQHHEHNLDETYGTSRSQPRPSPNAGSTFALRVADAGHAENCDRRAPARGVRPVTLGQHGPRRCVLRFPVQSGLGFEGGHHVHDQLYHRRPRRGSLPANRGDGRRGVLGRIRRRHPDQLRHRPAHSSAPGAAKPISACSRSDGLTSSCSGAGWKRPAACAPPSLDGCPPWPASTATANRNGWSIAIRPSTCAAPRSTTNPGPSAWTATSSVPFSSRPAWARLETTPWRHCWR